MLLFLHPNCILLVVKIIGCVIITRLSSVLSAVFDEFVHGQDRYISRLVPLQFSLHHEQWTTVVEVLIHFWY